jgi:hypothetical protein
MWRFSEPEDAVLGFQQFTFILIAPKNYSGLSQLKGDSALARLDSLISN